METKRPRDKTVWIRGKGTLVQITSPHFVSGLVHRHGQPNLCAPIVSYMQDWSLPAIKRYCDKKGWHMLVINNWDSDEVDL